jgi:hypothetical protein
MMYFFSNLSKRPEQKSIRARCGLSGLALSSILCASAIAEENQFGFAAGLNIATAKSTQKESAATPLVDFTAESIPLTDWPACPAEMYRRVFKRVTGDVLAIDLGQIEIEILGICGDRAKEIGALMAEERSMLTSYQELRDAFLEEVEFQAETQAASLMAAQEDNDIEERLAFLEAENARLTQENTELVKTRESEGAPSEGLDGQIATFVEAVETCPDPRPIDRLEWFGVTRGVLADYWRIHVKPKGEDGPEKILRVGEDYEGMKVIDVDWPEHVEYEPTIVTAQDCAGVTELSKMPLKYMEFPSSIRVFSDRAGQNQDGTANGSDPASAGTAFIKPTFRRVGGSQ